MAMTDYLNDMPAQGNRKVVLVGTGFVGMSMAYTLMNHKGIDELVLVDVNTEKAEGEAMDLVHGLPYANGKESGFNGVIVVASNPCDIMTYVMQKATGLHPYQVLGSGTMLDTARLRYEIGNFFEVNPASVHGYIMGEHGDSSFVSWTNAYIGCKSLLEVVEERKVPFDQLQRIYEQVRELLTMVSVCLLLD